MAGNVRELQNFIERAVILSTQSVLRAPTFELEPLQALGKANNRMTGLEKVERDQDLFARRATKARQIPVTVLEIYRDFVT